MRYFFHLHNDIDSHDDEGQELANLAEARGHALDEAREMAAESVREGHLNLNHNVQVQDENGVFQFKVTFGEAVMITPDLQIN